MSCNSYLFFYFLLVVAVVVVVLVVIASDMCNKSNTQIFRRK